MCCSKKEVEEKVSAEELTGWLIYRKKHPDISTKIDISTAYIVYSMCLLVHKMFGKGNFNAKISDFILTYGIQDKEKHMDEMENRLKNFKYVFELASGMKGK